MKHKNNMGEKKSYCLYNNKDQERLLATANSEEEIIEVCQYYSDGVWFEYDEIKENVLDNERLYKKKVSFSKEPIEKPKYREKGIEFKWVK